MCEFCSFGAVKDELVSKVESELLCRAYFHMYLGDDAFDKEAKAKFGASLLSLFWGHNVIMQEFN